MARFGDDRPGEREKTLVMTGIIFALLGAHTMVEPVAQALFLVGWGPARLPYLYLLSLAPGAAVAWLYARFTRSERIERVFLVSLAVFAANLAFFRVALAFGWDWVKIVLYLWTNVFGVLATSQFWLLANHLFDAREAKRRFGLIGLGAILGGVLGGTLAARLAPRIGSEDLLLVATVFLALAAALLVVVARRQRETLVLRHSEGRKEAILARAGEAGAWPAIRGSRHLRLLIALGAATVFAATIVDYLFKTVASLHYPAQDQLTAFLGLFQAGLSAVSFLLQLGLVIAWAPLLRSAGVVGALAVLPAVLGLGSVALLLAPSLITAAGVKAADASLRYSLHRSTFELLFLPVPIDVRRRTKAVVDLFGERFARAAAGLVLLALLSSGLARPRLLAALLALAAVVLALIIRRLGQTYLASLRTSVAGRALDLEREPALLVDSAAIAVLRKALAEESPRQVAYAIELLGAAGGAWLAPDLRPLLLRPEGEIRLAALQQLRRLGGADELPFVAALVADPDDTVRSAAIGFLCEHGGAAWLERFLAHPDPRLRATALACLPDLGAAGRAAFTRERLQAAMAEAGPHRGFVRREVATALARAGDARHADLVEELLRDGAPETARAAIAAAAALAVPAHIDLLIERVADPALRAPARHALAAFGDRVLAAVERALIDPARSIALRAALPRVLAYVATPAAKALLVQHLADPDAEIRLASLKALGRLRSADAPPAVDAATLERSILAEARQHFEILAILHQARRATPTSPPRELLARALREQLDRSLERIFRLLGLCYPPRDIFSIYRQMQSGPLSRRASALELLDNLVAPDLKRIIFPIVEPPSLEASLETGRRLFQIPSGTVASGLQELARGADPWLRALAIHVAGVEGIAALQDLCVAAAAHGDPLVAAEGRLALDRFAARGPFPAAGEA